MQGLENDKWWLLILGVVKSVEGSPSDRKRAVVRAGLIAQAYNAATPEEVEAIFGNSLDDGLLKNNEESNSVRTGSCC